MLMANYALGISWNMLIEFMDHFNKRFFITHKNKRMVLFQAPPPHYHHKALQERERERERDEK